MHDYLVQHYDKLVIEQQYMYTVHVHIMQLICVKTVLPPLTGCGDSAESSCGKDDSSEDCWESGSEASVPMQNELAGKFKMRKILQVALYHNMQDCKICILARTRVSARLMACKIESCMMCASAKISCV